MKTLNIELVKELIATDKYGKWKRSDYEYALSGMYTYYTEWSLKKLPVLKELFFERALTHFHLIAGYVCFRDHNCFIEVKEVEPVKEYNFEVYTVNPTTGETGWDIKFRSVFAHSKEEARELLKQTPLFDCVILFNFGVKLDGYEFDLYNEGVKSFDRHSYMNNEITQTYR